MWIKKLLLLLCLVPSLLYSQEYISIKRSDWQKLQMSFLHLEKITDDSQKQVTDLSKMLTDSTILTENLNQQLESYRTQTIDLNLQLESRNLLISNTKLELTDLQGITNQQFQSITTLEESLNTMSKKIENLKLILKITIPTALILGAGSVLMVQYFIKYYLML